MTLDVMLRCIAHALTLVATQCDARIQILSCVPCLASLHLVAKKKNIWLRADYFRMS